jgi:hypothetical protein
MLNISIALAVCSIALLSGCSSLHGPAEQYAQKLSKVLQAYQDQTNRKVQTEQATYKRLASIYARAQDEDVMESLYLERSERAAQLADKLIQQEATRPVTLSEVRRWLRDYGTTDFSQTQPLLERESEDHARFLANLENLEIETKQIESLGQALDELAQPQSQTQRLKELAAFAERVGAEFEKLVCEDFTNMIKEQEKQLTQETDAVKKARLQGQIDALMERKKARKCSE